MTKKVYISELDSSLGHHLIEFFRDDHLDLDNYTLIVGTVIKDVKMNGVYQTIDFSKQAQLACRAILDCDVVILNLKSSSHEAQTIIRFLEIMHETVPKPIRVIGLSTMMTWEGTRGFQIEKDMGDKEKYISNILDENCWKRVEFKDEDYEKRISNNLFMKTYELENMLMKLNKYKNINSSVLCSGLIYGKDNFQLQPQILKALNWENLTLAGNGYNRVPMVHIDTLTESLGILIDKIDLPYAIAVDKSILTQNQIKTLLNKATQNNKSLKQRDPHFLTKDDCLWNFSQVLVSSSIFSSVAQHNFAQYAKNDLLIDFYEYNEYYPKQILVQIDNFDENTLKQLVETLSNYVFIVDQQEIDRLNQDMISKLVASEPQVIKKPSKNAPIKPSSSQQDRQPQFFYKQILEKLLKTRKYLNYAIIINKKIKEMVSKQYYCHQLIEIIQNEDEDHFQSEYKQVLYKSNEFYSILGIKIQEEKHQSNHVAPRQYQSREKDIYIPEKNLKKDEKMILMNQYLFDNVLGPISEAKFNMRLSKKEQSLKNFISELKGIYNRGNYKSCLQYQNKPTIK